MSSIENCLRENMMQKNAKAALQIVLGLVTALPLLADWPSFKDDSARASISIGQTLVPPLELKTRSTFPANKYAEYASPVNAVLGTNDLMFSGNSAGLFAAFPSTPKFPALVPLWSKQLGGSIYSTPSYFDLGSGSAPKRVYVTSVTGLLFCYDANLGTLVWQQDLGSASLSSPLVYAIGSSALVVVATNDGQVRAWNADSGTPVWVSSIKASSYIYASPLFDPVNANVVVPSYDGYLYAFQAATGTLAWPRKKVDPTRGTPALVHGIIWNLSKYGVLSAINAATGSDAFSTYVFGKDASSSVVAFDQGSSTMVIGTFEDGTVFCRSYPFAGIGGGGGVPTLWTRSLPTVGGIHSSPSVANGALYLGTNDGRIEILDLSNGHTLQEIAVNHAAGVRGNPSLYQNSLYVMSDNGEVSVYGMPVAQILVTGNMTPPTGSREIYQFQALDANGNLVPSFNEDLILTSVLGIPVNISPASIHFDKGYANVSITFIQSAGTRISVATNNGFRVKNWTNMDLLVAGPLAVPTPPSTGYYDYMVVQNHSSTDAKVDSTIQISDGSGFFDAAGKITHSPRELNDDASDFRIYDEHGLPVNFHVLTNPKHVNTIIRFKVPYLAPNEYKVYLTTFGTPALGFPAGYESTPYLSTIYKLADSYDGPPVDLTKFSYTSGFFNGPQSGDLYIGAPFTIHSTPAQQLDSSYGVRYEFKAQSLGSQNSAYSASVQDDSGSGYKFSVTTGNTSGSRFISALWPGSSFGVQATDGPQSGEVKYYVSKISPSLFAGGRDFGDVSSSGTDYGLNVGTQLSGNAALELPLLNSSLNLTGSSDQFRDTGQIGWVVGWEVKADEPTAALLDKKVTPPTWWTYGAVTNDPVTETAWAGFSGEADFKLPLPSVVHEYSAMVDPVDIVLAEGRAYVLDAAENRIRVIDQVQHTEASSIPLSVSHLSRP